MEMDASLKEYQAALDAQFEERKAMILSQEEKDLAVEVEAVKRQGNQKLAHEHLVNKRALSQKETEFKDKLFQEDASCWNNSSHAATKGILAHRQGALCFLFKVMLFRCISWIQINNNVIIFCK